MLGGEDGDFEGSKGAAGIAIAFERPDLVGVSGDGELKFAVAAVGVSDGALQDFGDVRLGEGFEAEEGAATDEGGVAREERVFGGGTDEGDQAALDIVQQDILLGAGEAVDLIQEEDGAAAAGLEAAGGFIDDLADALDADGCGVLALEVTLGVGRDEFGECGFAGAGGAVEDEGGDRVGLEHAAEELAFAEDVLLSGELVEGARAHASSQGLDAAECCFALWCPQVLHREMLGMCGRGFATIRP